MRQAIRLAALAAVCVAITPAHGQPKERIVNVYNWSDYIAPTVVEDFTKQTGIKVRYDTFDSNGTIDSWDIVFKPESLAKFKDCGVHLLDSSDDILAAALHYLGLDPNSANETDLQAAAALVMKIRPYVRKFHSSEYLNALASGEICLAVGFSGGINQSQRRATEAKNGVEIGYSIPKEGAQLWFDNLAIPRDARNTAEALAFIN